MNGKTLLAEAIEMKDEIVENRRAIHRAPEVGAHLPQTVQFVEEKLRLLGYEPRDRNGVLLNPRLPYPHFYALFSYCQSY